MKKKLIITITLFTLLITPTLVTAAVNDNAGKSVVMKLMGSTDSTDTSTVFGLLRSIIDLTGSESDTTDASGFANASINGKLNYLDAQVEELKQLCQ